MDKDQIKALLARYNEGNATDEEKALLETWYLNHVTKTPLDLSEDQIGQDIDDVYDLLPRQKRIVALWPRIAAAASILIIFSIGGYLYFKKQAPVQQVALLKPGTFKNDVLPGKNKAYLTLANGQQVTVNTASGNLARQGNTNIQKNADGEVVYEGGDAHVTEVSYNTFTVPRGGGKHELRLADGTIAVLDAGSSIHFPVAFNGKDRRVSITGQVYFEVVHNVKQPFFVTAKGQTIEDIGTHFNVNAYDDEPSVKTTLLEGSVKIGSSVLKPGQQAIVAPDGKLMITSAIDLEQVMAWKNDKFSFNRNTDVQAVMRQLSRWYDLDVAYQGGGKQYHFAGDMPRNSKLSDVLKILEFNGLQFSIDGKKLTVYQ